MPRKIHSAIRAEVLRLADLHLSAKEIRAQIRDNGFVAPYGDPVPSVRTILRWMKQPREPQPGPQWWWTFEDGDARVVLPMLAAVAEASDGGIDSSIFERPVAEQARRIAVEFPDIPPIELYYLASQYVLVDAEEGRRRKNMAKPWLYVAGMRSSLDFYLAFAPWRDGARRYSDAIRAGILGRVAALRTPSTAALVSDLPSDTEVIDWPFER